MKPFRVLFSLWLLAGFGALAGSILGNAFGPTGLQLGAIAGGAAATAGGVALAARFAWLPPGTRTLATVGALLGFGLAAALAVTNLHTPVIPVLSSGLVGAGTLLGAGVAIGLRRGA
jgi:hypothetical protein